ncbi:MAG TPA: SCO family protein [Pyrinomonadaceae bacterium]|nr:SCO family protein [Pyrinomonadaceae bacterium]
MERRTLLKRLGHASLAAAPAIVTASASARAQVSPAPEKKRGPRDGYFPDVVLRTHENKQVRFYEDLIQGRIVVINMFYARCEGICPGMTANLVRVQRLMSDRIGRDIFMYSITLKPGQDSPAVLADYARAYKIGPGWQLLTGAPSDIEALRRKLGFVDPDPVLDRTLSTHTGVVKYGNETLDRWGACPAMKAPQQIVKTILIADHPKNLPFYKGGARS